MALGTPVGRDRSATASELSEWNQGCVVFRSARPAAYVGQCECVGGVSVLASVDKAASDRRWWLGGFQEFRSNPATRLEMGKGQLIFILQN
ncbi:putative histidine kinase [Anopheles sinensis]|uniref:Putative histidine kinase n=1 Tax=Anopheles sinensis TaxID=74873 RepID=A0A084WDD0_ANOSI|nr:putative histidine kinase [Anopheles sinensis]